MIKRLVAKFMFRAMTIWDALRDMRRPSAQLWVPQEGLATPPVPLADGPDVVRLVATDSGSGSIIPATAFQLAVLSKSPSSYWELNDTNGLQAYDQTGGGNTGTLVGGVTAGVSGPFPGVGAMAFTASTTGWIYTTDSLAGPQTYTVLAGFSTTSGGILLEFTNPQATATGNWDRLLYVDTTGALRAGAYNGAVYTVASPSAVNDGAFHLGGVVASSAGLALWLDGVEVASTTTAGSTTFTGWWNIGGLWMGTPTGGWPDGDASGYYSLTGTLANAATWNTRDLSPSDWADLWTAWQSSASGG